MKQKHLKWYWRLLCIPSMGTLKNIYSHWVYKLTTNEMGQAMGYWIREGPLSALIEEKMFETIWNDKMIRWSRNQRPKLKLAQDFKQGW